MRILVKSSDNVSYGGILRGVIPRFWGVTQGDPLSPTIYNVVVEAVVRKWI